MAYSRDVKDLHVGQLLFTFPHDELLSNNDYIAVMNNTYLRKLPFATMLIDRFGLSTSPKNQECIKRGLVCMGWLDHMLDESPDRKASLRAYTDLVGTLAQPKEALSLPPWIRPEVQNSVALLYNATYDLPQENKVRIAKKAQRIGAISLEKASVTSVADYWAVLSEEGALSSDVVIECLDVSTQDVEAYKRLHTFNARAMVAATILDAALDLKQDYKEGLTGVEPTLLNHFFLYKKALSHLPYIAKNLGVKGLFTIAKVGIN